MREIRRKGPRGAGKAAILLPCYVGSDYGKHKMCQGVPGIYRGTKNRSRVKRAYFTRHTSTHTGSPDTSAENSQRAFFA